MCEIKMGIEAEDRVTGFVGVITGKAQYLDGTQRCQLTPTMSDSGSLRDAEWFDSFRIKATENDKIGFKVQKVNECS